LAKLSNLVPGGGIWMNTQRPEWNDANNALAGYGLSVVTLCYLRRHLHFLAGLMRGMEEGRVPISAEVVEWMDRVGSVLEGQAGESRRKTVDALGGAFSDYRQRVYESGLSGRRETGYSELASFFELALKAVDHSIEENRMESGLYHSYNILNFEGQEGEIAVGRLYEMIEGQVAALSSGVLGPGETSAMLGALFGSDIYREDQHSFMLYPRRELPSFMDRNIVPEDRVMNIRLLVDMLERGEGSLIQRDSGGVLRFNGDLSNARDIETVLDRLAEDPDWSDMVEQDRGAVFEVFESVFRHRSFTGRSGTMYGYEGIGCIYWHMISKLLLAVQEVTVRTFRAGASDGSRDSLAEYYYRVRSGLSFEKTAREYGAFPTDPYSHTPLHSGAQQPGMTGQVKEEIITRFGELGLVVDGGIVSFDPVILRAEEFLELPETFEYFDTGGKRRSIELQPGSLAFTFCQVPVIYKTGGEGKRIRVTAASGDVTERQGSSLDREESRSIFRRTGAIERIDVVIDPGALLVRQDPLRSWQL
ncbi:MAG TPA: hypothetical protein VLA34_11580, partial [Candidatus Krumholzibacterium sp.]|nr:hypothetical protein [Candidatus Krumholzibacterium sp.]